MATQLKHCQSETLALRLKKVKKFAWHLLTNNALLANVSGMWDKLISFINAIIIHGLLVAMVFLNVEWFFKPHLLSSPPPEKIMRAVAMNENQVLAAVKNIKNNFTDRNELLLAHEQQLEKKQRQVEQTVVKEQQRLNELRQQQKQQQQQLDKLKQRRWAKAAELEELKRQRAEQKRLEREAQEKKRIAEAQRRIAQEAAKREKKQREREEEAQRQAERIRQEEEAQRQAEQARQEAERQARLAAEEAQRQAAAERAKQEAEKQAREAEERRQAQEKANAARQLDDQERIRQVIELIQEKIKNQWIKPSGIPDNLACIIYIRLKLGGKVGSARVIESSGNMAFDYSAEVAVRRASPLPIPVDLFDKFVEFQLRFRP